MNSPSKADSTARKTRGIHFLELCIANRRKTTRRSPRSINALVWVGAVLFGFALAVRAQSPMPDSFDPGANGSVKSVAIQPDGRLVVAGDFTSLGGQNQSYIGRLNPDGTVDASFVGRANAVIICLALQADGKIVVGGLFTELCGQARSGLGRLNVDGSLDTDFNPRATPLAGTPSVSALAVQQDGRIILGGHFATLDGQPHKSIARLNADGTLDSLFTPQVNGSVSAVAVQPDQRILVGGTFPSIGDERRWNIARFSATGLLDTSFDPGVSGTGWPGMVYALAVQADGKILVGGSFDTLAWQGRSCVGRLNANGTLDTGFNRPANSSVLCLAVQADGKILLGGAFTTVGGQPRNRIARLNANGTLDTTFNPGTGGDDYPNVHTLALQPDGRILIGGDFTTLGGQPRNHVARLDNTAPAMQSLTSDGSTTTWLRGGSSPEVWRTTFESSTNGIDWLLLGAGVRIPGGWRLNGLTIPANATIRARGFVTGGGGADWFVEATARAVPPAPAILVHDGHFGFVANQFGFSISGVPGQNVILEGSQNLLDWLPVSTNTLGDTPAYVNDPESKALPHRCYRLRLTE